MSDDTPAYSIEPIWVVEATYASKRGSDAFPETMLEIEGDGGSLMLTKGEKLTVTRVAYVPMSMPSK